MPNLYGHLTSQGVLNGSLQTIVFANNYNDLVNKPSINSVELQGNKTAADLGLLTAGDIPVDSVNGKQGVVILDGDDIEYEAGTSVNSKITDLEAEIGSGPVVSVNGQQGVVELDGTDINYSLTKTLNQKIDEVAASIPVVNYPVTSVNTKTGDVVLDGDDIDYAEGVTVNDQIGTNTADIGDLSSLTTSVKSSLVGAVNEIARYTPVYGNTASGAIATFYTSLALPLQDCKIGISGSGATGANIQRCNNAFASLWDIDSSFKGSVVWNQLFPIKSNTYTETGWNSHFNNDGSVTIEVTSLTGTATYPNICNLGTSSFIQGHKYAFLGSTNNIRFRLKTFNADGNTIFNCQTPTFNNIGVAFTNLPQGSYNCYLQLFDLTQMFGTAIADYIYGLEQANAGAGVAFFKSLYPDDYYAYDSGTSELVGNNLAYADWSSLGTITEGSLDVTTGKLTVVNGSMGAGDYQITPIPINQLSGTNNVFTDTNGNTSVVYACSLKDYIDSQ